LGHPGALKRFNNAAQLAHVNPRDVVSDIFDGCVGFTAMRNGKNRIAFAFCFFGENQDVPLPRSA
jgi:hypothetical protein